MIVSSPYYDRHLVQCDTCADMRMTAPTRQEAVAAAEADGWTFDPAFGTRCTDCRPRPVKAAA